MYPALEPGWRHQGGPRMVPAICTRTWLVHGCAIPRVPPPSARHTSPLRRRSVGSGIAKPLVPGGLLSCSSRTGVRAWSAPENKPSGPPEAERRPATWEGWEPHTHRGSLKLHSLMSLAGFGFGLLALVSAPHVAHSHVCASQPPKSSNPSCNPTNLSRGKLRRSAPSCRALSAHRDHA